MNTNKTNKTVIVIIVAIALAGIAIFVPWGRLLQPEQKAVPLQAQESQISYYMNRNAGYDFCTHISLIEQTDTDGNPYYVGKLDPELDIMLASLVETYNVDPLTTKHITVDIVRYNLTEGILEATSKNVDDSAFAHFLRWCDTPADLVYKEDLYSDGILIHSAGDTTENQSVSNFEFIFNKGKDSTIVFFKFSWE